MHSSYPVNLSEKVKDGFSFICISKVFEEKKLDVDKSSMMKCMN